MSGPPEAARSREACPRCGAHRLTLLHFPDTKARGVQQYDELIGMGDPSPDTPPGIGCLVCGAEWPNLEAFRAESAQRNGSRSG